MTGTSDGSISSPLELRELCREYYPSRENGFDLLDAPDSCLSWLLSVLHQNPVPAPDIQIPAWESLIDLISPHQVLPYLFYCLRDAPPGCSPPEPIMKTLHTRFLQRSYSADCSVKQAADLISACDNQGIRVLIMKGTALSQTVYPHPATRTGSDIDILVSPNQYNGCRDVLLDLGYHLGYDTFQVMPEFYHHACFLPARQKKDQKVIELHWRPLFLPGPGHEVSSAELIRRSSRVSTRYGTIYTFDPVDAFFHTAIHMCLAHEPMLRLSWVMDISLLAREITRLGMWPEAMTRSIEWQGRFAAERAVALAGYWTGLKLPEEYDSSLWPVLGAGDEFALRHMNERRAGKELLLHQIVAGMPTIPKKVRAGYHWVFRPDLIYGGYQDISWWEAPAAHARMLYNHYQQIRRLS